MKNGEGTGGMKFRRKGPHREDRKDGINNAEVAWLKEYLTQVYEDWHEEKVGFYLHQAPDSFYDNWVLIRHHHHVQG